MSDSITRFMRLRCGSPWILHAICVAVCVSGCAHEPVATTLPPYPVSSDIEAVPAVIKQSSTPESTTDLSEPQETSTQISDDRFSFVVNDLSITEALRQFGKAYGINFVVEEAVVGNTTVDFQDLGLNQVLTLMLTRSGYYWEEIDGVIHVKATVTRQFTVDYPRLIREGQSRTVATVSSGETSSAGSSGGASESGQVSINQADRVDFWNELEKQLGALVSESGTLIVNRLAGSVLVRDSYPRVKDIEGYLAQVQQAIRRQVEISVKIFEVTLDDSTAVGVDWGRIANVLDTSDAVSASVSGVLDSPIGGLQSRPPVLNLSYRDVGGDRDVSALVAALSQQGEVELVSQPHVRTMNNQTALIKVGTDRTFFRREQSIDSTSAGSITTATDVPQVVTEGVVLAITPQISEADDVMMDVSPVVTRVSSVTTVQDGNGRVQSSAPNLDVTQVTSLVRARSGASVVVGGLIQTQRSYAERGLPGTRRLGVLRRLAGGSYSAVVKKELVMMLTPRVVR
ncbi:MAG: secretin N-terminal domain-containing protein [Pseudomonadota bacterium]